LLGKSSLVGLESFNFNFDSFLFQALLLLLLLDHIFLSLSVFSLIIDKAHILDHFVDNFLLIEDLSVGSIGLLKDFALRFTL